MRKKMGLHLLLPLFQIRLGLQMPQQHLIRSVVFVILLVFVAAADAKELLPNHAITMHNSVDEVVDKLADELVDRVLTAWPLHHADLNHATLAQTQLGARQVGLQHVPPSPSLCPRFPFHVPRSPFRSLPRSSQSKFVAGSRTQPISHAYSEQGTDFRGQLAVPKAGAVRIRMGEECRLQILFLPEFQYDAGMESGGIGKAMSVPTLTAPNRLALDLDPTTITIPPPPPPPGLSIATYPLRFSGTLNPDTGTVKLEFEAEYHVTGLSFLDKKLPVRATLTTQGKGQRLDDEGKAKLAGVATVPRTGDSLVDNLLLLPSEVNVVFEAQFEFFGKEQVLPALRAQNLDRNLNSAPSSR